MQSEPVSPPPMTMTCLSLSEDVLGVGDGGRNLAGDAAVLLRQEVHGEVDAVELAARRLGEEVEGRLRAAGEQHRVVLGLELLGGDVHADVDVAVEGDALGLHLLHAPGNDALLHLEVGDAINQQPARLGVPLVDVHLVAGARQLLGGGEAGRARADDGDALAGLGLRRLGRDPAFREGAVGDRALDRLDGDRHVVDVERAGGLARGGADAARHLGEVVGRVQVERRALPVAVIDEVVPVGDLVVDRAAGVTIGDAAIHAARCLDLGLLLARRLHELVPVLHALGDGRVLALRPLELEKPRYLAHLSVHALVVVAASSGVGPSRSDAQCLSSFHGVAIIFKPSLP